MKTKQFIILFVALMLPCLVMAQSASKSIFDKYADKENFDSVIISGELFKLFVNDDGKATVNNMSIDTKGFDISAVRGVRLLNLNGKENLALFTDFVKEIDKAFKADKPKYTELMQINMNGEKLNVLALKDKSMINEIVVYRKNETDKGATLIYIEGPFKEEAVNKVIKEAMKK